MPVPVIKIGHLTTEAQFHPHHAATPPSRWELVQLTASDRTRPPRTPAPDLRTPASRRAPNDRARRPRNYSKRPRPASRTAAAEGQRRVEIRSAGHASRNGTTAAGQRRCQVSGNESTLSLKIAGVVVSWGRATAAGQRCCWRVVGVVVLWGRATAGGQRCCWRVVGVVVSWGRATAAGQRCCWRVVGVVVSWGRATAAGQRCCCLRAATGGRRSNALPTSLGSSGPHWRGANVATPAAIGGQRGESGGWICGCPAPEIGPDTPSPPSSRWVLASRARMRGRRSW
jgi:hypothetical protein